MYLHKTIKAVSIYKIVNKTFIYIGCETYYHIFRKLRGDVSEFELWKHFHYVKHLLHEHFATKLKFDNRVIMHPENI
jgi:hypothetical protein